MSGLFDRRTAVRLGSLYRLGMAALLALTCVACAINRGAPADLLPNHSAAEASSPLGGEALLQRKHEMRRAYGDMIHFHATLASLHYRKDKNGLVLFSKFLDAYLGIHVDRDHLLRLEVRPVVFGRDRSLDLLDQR